MTSVTRLDHAYTLEFMGAPYLESGWLQHGAYGALAPLACVPSALVYGAEQAGGLGQGFVTFANGSVQGAEALAPRPSNAVVDRFFPPTLYHDSLNGFTSPDAIYSHDAGLLDAKKCQVSVPPSRFAGLLRLLVQGAYGSAPRRYELDTSSGALAIDGVRLAHSGAGSHWVACFAQARPPGSTGDNTFHNSRAPLAADGAEGSFWEDTASKLWYGPKAYGAWGDGHRLGREYWLASVGAGKATFVYIETARAVCDNAATGLAARKLHAVLLGSSKITRRSLAFKIGAVQGEPLAYGWKPGADGSEAQIVCHEAEGGHRVARHYRLSVTASDAGEPVSVSLKLVEEAPWDVTAGVLALWVPDWAEGMQVAVRPAEPNFQHWAPFACSAPLYVARGGVVRVHLGGTGPGASGGFSGAGVDANGGIAALPSDSDVSDYSVTGGEESRGGAGFGTLDIWGPLLGPPLSSPTHPVGYVSDPATLVNEQFGCSVQVVRSVYSNHATGAVAMLLIPFDDCDAVVWGFTGTESFSSHWTSTTDGQSWPTRITTSYFKESDPPGHGTWEDNGAYTWPTMGFMWGVETAHTDEGAASRFVAPVVKVTASGTATVSPALTLYFNPQIGPSGNPYIQASNVRSCSGLPYIYSLSNAESGSSGWPGGVPVGWA